MLGLGTKSADRGGPGPAGPLDRIGRRNSGDPRSEATAVAAPVDRASRIAAAAASLGESVTPRLRALVAGGAPAGEVTRQAGAFAMIHFRRQGGMLAAL